MTYEQIRLETNGAVATITLSRPERLNAWTYQMSRELSQAIEHVNAADDLGAMIITGEGRGFCAGADIQDTFQSQIDGDTPKRDNRASRLGRSDPAFQAHHCCRQRRQCWCGRHDDSAL